MNIPLAEKIREVESEEDLELEKATRQDKLAGSQNEFSARARLAFLQKHYREAARLLLYQLYQHPEDYHALVDLGGTYAKMHDYKISDECFELAMENTADPSILITVASSYINRGEYNKAMEVLKKALQKNPQNHLAYVQLGRLYQKLGNQKGARQKIEAAYRLQPHDEMVVNWMGILAFQNGSMTEARKYFLQVMVINPKNEVANNHLGQICFGEKKMDRARNHFLRTLTINPENEFALYNLASINFREGNLDEAESYLERIFSTDPRNIYALNLRGKLYHTRGLLTEAINCYLYILRLHSGDRIALKNLVSLYRKVGNFELAGHYLGILEKRHPAPPRGKFEQPKK